MYWVTWIAEMDPATVLESRSVRGRAVLPLKLLGEDPSWPFPGSVGPRNLVDFVIALFQSLPLCAVSLSLLVRTTVTLE
jgi:hypothetical protein